MIFIAKKCFTIETRLEKSSFLMNYLEKDMRKQSRIFRVVWKLIQKKKFTQSKLNTYLQITYQIDKRTANTLIQTARGRLKALKELKELERKNLITRISTIERQIGKLSEEIQELKSKVIKNQETQKQLEKYRKKKEAIWQKKQRLNRMRQKLKNYKNQDYFSICWGGKRLFKAQHYLEQNGFHSHQGWLHAYKKQRDGQINFIGSAEEPNGNQNCQLRYDEKEDSFSLRVRKDLEFMKNEKDKFFIISRLQFQHHRNKLIESIQSASTPFTFRILRRGRKWYLQVIFTWVVEEEEGVYKTDYGTIGLDFNDGFISWSETDYYGNLVGQIHFPLKYHGTGNKADSELQEVVAKIVKLAKEKEKPIGIEELDFRKTKAKMVKAYNKFSKRYQKMIHRLDYSRYKEKVENACFRENIKLILVNPAYTSQIGMRKYGEKRKLNRHQAASYVIARMAQGYQDRIRI